MTGFGYGTDEAEDGGKVKGDCEYNKNRLSFIDVEIESSTRDQIISRLLSINHFSI